MSSVSISRFRRSGNPNLVSSNSDRIKPMTYKIDTCRSLARCLALLGSGKDWLAQCQDNVTEWTEAIVLAGWFPSGAAL